MNDCIGLLENGFKLLYKIYNNKHFIYSRKFDIDYYYNNILTTNLLQNELEIYNDTDKYSIKLDIVAFVLYNDELIYINSKGNLITLVFPNLNPEIK